jgi:hypothetical protein
MPLFDAYARMKCANARTAWRFTGAKARTVYNVARRGQSADGDMARWTGHDVANHCGTRQIYRSSGGDAQQQTA